MKTNKKERDEIKKVEMEKGKKMIIVRDEQTKQFKPTV